MPANLSSSVCLLSALVLSFNAWTATAVAEVTAKQALGLKPLQQGIDMTVPSASEADECTVQSVKDAGLAGWMVLDQAGQVLRRFLDTNGDQKVDQWCYYKGGIEVYRDIDHNHNGKADQYRWLGTAGIRWGLDDDENGEVDRWVNISAEEVSAEVTHALATRDPRRFQRLLPTAQEVRDLGIGPAKEAEILKMVEQASRDFESLAKQQTLVTSRTKWMHFGGSRPGVVPAGQDGATKDVIVYDNVAAIVQTGDQHAQIEVGTLVQTSQGWRAIQLPRGLRGDQAESVAGGYFFQEPSMRQVEVAANGAGLSEDVQNLIKQLEQIDKLMPSASGPQQLAKLHAQRANVLEQLAINATDAKERDAWIRQFADGISTAVQSGGYPEGMKRLQQLDEALQQDGQASDLASYVKFRLLSAEYGLNIQKSDGDFEKIQAKWTQDLQQFVKDYPRGEDAAEAMLQLAVSDEFAGEADNAIVWYRKIVAQFGDLPNAKKAAGAIRRLESVGQSLQLHGPTLDGKTASLSSLRGRTILVHYWATWCEPCKQDMTLLKSLQAKYARRGFTLLGVNLDSVRGDAVRYLQANSLPWAHLYEPGGLDSRLALEMGVLTLPTMLLIDDQGRVLNRNISAGELDEELGKRLR